MINEVFIFQCHPCHHQINITEYHCPAFSCNAISNLSEIEDEEIITSNTWLTLKSPILTVPPRVTNKLSGLRSPCTILCIFKGNMIRFVITSKPIKFHIMEENCMRKSYKVSSILKSSSFLSSSPHTPNPPPCPRTKKNPNKKHKDIAEVFPSQTIVLNMHRTIIKVLSCPSLLAR